MSAHLSPEEALRYHRQVTLAGIGEHGQEKLKHARVFPAGLGGLGSVSDNTAHQRTLTIIYLHGGGYITGSARSMPSIPVLLSRTFGLRDVINK